MKIDRIMEQILGEEEGLTMWKVVMTLTHEVIGLTAIALWMIGIAAAKGWLWVALSSLLPPVAWVFAAKYFLGVQG